jgi:hypothetical protein
MRGRGIVFPCRFPDPDADSDADTAVEEGGLGGSAIFHG